MRDRRLIFALFAVLPAVVAAASVMFGGSMMGPREVFEGLFRSGVSDGTYQAIIWKIRIPRIWLSMIVGAGLAASGCVFQGMLKNPLADPYTLGISGGAALGATLSIVTGLAGFTAFSLPLFAFAGALGCFAAVYALASTKNFSNHSLILTGVIIGYVCSSIVLALVAVISPEKLHASIIWLTGDLSSPDMALILPASVLIAVCVAVLFAFSRELNALTLGEEKAYNLGVESEKIKKTVFIVASLITGVCVSMSGIIGFVGLVVPHFTRKIVGPDHRFLIPASALCGAAFLPVCDTLARTVIAPVELPVGVITGIFGGVFFLFFIINPVREN
ncbi:MAG: iron ABC transporter permease [Endomicrobiales bacterium]|nr:iron ABC transporter permease [Endomicrobiales bacterium]